MRLAIGVLVGIVAAALVAWFLWPKTPVSTRFMTEYHRTSAADSGVTREIAAEAAQRPVLATKISGGTSAAYTLKPRAKAAIARVDSTATEAPGFRQAVSEAMGLQDSIIEAQDSVISGLREDSAILSRMLDLSEAGRAVNLRADSLLSVAADSTVTVLQVRERAAFRRGVLWGAAGGVLAVIAVVWALP